MEHAKYCYTHYPTIVNNIPKEKNIYSNTMDDYAVIDDSLAKSQTDIGESSNLAQICQSYDCNFEDSRFSDYVCILSIIAQCSIDNAKRKFDIDISDEIKRIKKEMDISSNKYPKFWRIIRKGFNKQNINKDLNCPMNCLYDLDFPKFRSRESTLPMDRFFIKHPLEKDRKQCKKVEKLISDYSLTVLQYQLSGMDSEDSLVMRSDFDALIRDIKKTYISTNYKGLMSWLIDRAFVVTPSVSLRQNTLKTVIGKNKSTLLKVLYSVSPKSFMECFVENPEKV